MYPPNDNGKVPVTAYFKNSSKFVVYIAVPSKLSETSLSLATPSVFDVSAFSSPFIAESVLASPLSSELFSIYVNS